MAADSSGGPPGIATWYRAKAEPAFEDMLIKLRRVMIATFSGTRPGQPDDDQIRAVLAAWETVVA